MEIAFHKIFNPSKIIVVSFYTTYNIYDREKDFFIFSLNKLKINHIIYKINSNTELDKNQKLNIIKNWNYITYIKPKILLNIFDTFKYKHLLWCDIDSMFFQVPEEIHSFEKDLGFCFKTTKNGVKKLISGVIYLRNTDNSISLLNLWLKKIENVNISNINLANYMDLSDQEILDNIINENKFEYSILNKKYVGIYDKILLKNEKYSDYYIVHFQASRRNNPKILINPEYHNEKFWIKKFRDNLFKI